MVLVTFSADLFSFLCNRNGTGMQGNSRGIVCCVSLMNPASAFACVGPSPFLVVLPLQLMQMLFAFQRWHHRWWFLWCATICIRFRGKETERVTQARQIGGKGGPRTLFPSSYLFPEMQFVCAWETPETVSGVSRPTIIRSQSLGLPRPVVGVWHVKLTNFPRYFFTIYPNVRTHIPQTETEWVCVAELPRVSPFPCLPMRVFIIREVRSEDSHLHLHAVRLIL